MVHICKIYGRKIDLNFQDIKEPVHNGRYRRGPIYSLMTQGWTFKPSLLSQKELKQIEDQASIIYKQILHDYKIVKKNGFKLNEISQLYNNIITSKRHSAEENPDIIINPVYMAIRKFKHDGYIKKLRDKAVQKETSKYVLK